MKRVMLACLLAVTAVSARSDDLITDYERSGYVATPRYAETIEYCVRLADASRWVEYTTFGKSPQGRDLPLLIADGDGDFTPDRVKRRSKAVVLIQAGIHSGEINGKDAGLMLLRDIAGKHSELLDHVTILFIPIFNVDGHERFGPYNRVNQNGPKEMGWRATAQNLNLNRDFLKADSPEMREWIRLFNRWLPDFVIDCHSTDGADYQYVVTYILNCLGNAAPSLSTWSRDVYLEHVKVSMAEAGFEMTPYVFLREWPNPTAGMRGWAAPPRFSDGYAAIRNRPGLVIETHMMKDYKLRVEATYALLKQTVELLNTEYESLKAAIEEAEALTSSSRLRDQPFALNFGPGDESETIEFKGKKMEAVESELTGGTWFRFFDEPETFAIEYFEKQISTALVDLPEAYIIPPEWQEVIDLLKLHGVETRRLQRPAQIAVSSYRFENPDWQDTPYEGRFPLSFDMREFEEERTYPAGSVIVDMNQINARVAAHALEPRGPDSFVLWGFFDTIFEQKEYTESYVMEKMAREMLAKDNAIRLEFEEKKKEDPEFAENPTAILNWFFQRTPYWDARKDVYPIGRVFDRHAVDNL